MAVSPFHKYTGAPVPFGAGAFTEEGPTSEDLNDLMFGGKNSVPDENGGIAITTRQMNTLGYLATIGPYLLRMGYPFGNQPIQWPIGNNGTTAIGYPKGAIVSVLYDNGYVREYISKVDNNTDTLPWDLRENNPDADGAIDESNENDYWKPIISKTQFNFFPNYESPSITNIDVSASQELNQTIQHNGWIEVRRTIPNYSEAVRRLYTTDSQKMQLTITIDDAYDITINMMEGETASRFLSVNQKIVLKKAASTGSYGGMSIVVTTFPFKVVE